MGFNEKKYTNELLYDFLLDVCKNASERVERAKKIILAENTPENVKIKNAYSWVDDSYDFSNKKQSLNEFESEVGIVHEELKMPWNND